MKRNSKQTKNIDTNVEIESDYKELNNQEQQAQNVSLINRTRSIQGKQRAISHSSAHKVRKMIVPHSIYYNHKDNLFLSPRPLTFLYLNRALPSSFHSLSPHALFSMGCKLRWPRRRARARAAPEWHNAFRTGFIPANASHFSHWPELHATLSLLLLLCYLLSFTFFRFSILVFHPPSNPLRPSFSIPPPLFLAHC